MQTEPRPKTAAHRRGALGIALAVLCLLLALGAASGAVAAPSDQPEPQDWGTDGEVFAVAPAPDGSTYIGGQFTLIRQLTGGFAAIDAATGAPDTRWPVVNGTVQAVAPDGKGGWFIGGGFSAVGGEPRQNLAHIRADGTLAPDWNPSADDGVRALAVSGNTIYAGGEFNEIGGQARSRIAALNATTGALTDWSPNANAQVSALAVSGDGDTLYAGGVFTRIGGQDRNRIAALDATTGAANPTWNPGADDGVRALALSGDTLYAGGDFNQIGGQARSRIAALNATTGAADPTWSPNANAQVSALAVSGDGDTLYAGGVFTRIGGQDRNRIAALDATTGAADQTWNPGADKMVSALALSGDGDTLYAGGNFNRIGGQARNYIAAFNLADGTLTGWNPGANGFVRALALSGDGDTVYAGGEFSMLGGLERENIARVTRDGAVDPTWDPGANNRVMALALTGDGDTLYVGGGFTQIGGQARNHIAALDATTGAADSTWNPGANNWVIALALSGDGDTIYAGGLFTQIGGQTRNRIAALDATTGTADSTWSHGADNWVRVLALSGDGDTIYAGGVFTQIGGQARNRIAALDATTGAATDWNHDADGMVEALALNGDTLYAGGDFTQIGGQARNYIAAFNLADGTLTGWNPGANGFVRALALSGDGDTLYAGGVFTQIGGQARNRIAALDATTGAADPTWNPDADGLVNALAVSSEMLLLHAGGSFTQIGGKLRGGYTRFDALGIPPETTIHGVPDGWSKVPVRLIFSATHEGGVAVALTEYSLDEGDWTPVPPGGLEIIDDGVYELQYRSVDVAGRVEEAKTAEVRIDSVAPQTTAAGLPDGWTAGPVTVTFTVVEEGSGVEKTEYSLDEGDWTPAPPDGLEITDDGVHELQYRSVDLAGNAEDPKTAGVRIDSVAPQTTAAGVPAGWTNAPVTVTFTVVEEGSGVGKTEYKLGAGDWTPVPPGGLETSADGVHELQYRSVDVARNVEAAKTAQVRIDTKKPSTAAPKQATARRGAKAKLRYRVTDAVPGSGKAVVVIKVRNPKGKLVKTLKLGRRPVKSALQSTSFKVPKKWQPGTYRFSVYATDLAGNKQLKVASNKLLVR